MRTRARKRIFDFVARHPGTSASQVARGLGMTPPAVRHHLAILRSDGRIELAPVTARGGRGRPELQHRVSEQHLGNNLAMLTDSLLMAWKGAQTAPRAGQRLISALARGLTAQLGPIETEAAASRIKLMVARLNLLHYEAHWEAGAEGPRLIFGHCPYAAVIKEHPELCQMDARVVSEIMRTTAQQVAKIDPSGPTGSQCIFSLR